MNLYKMSDEVTIVFKRAKTVVKITFSPATFSVTMEKYVFIDFRRQN